MKNISKFLFIGLLLTSVLLSTVSPAFAENLQRHGLYPLNKIQNATVNVAHFAPFANTPVGTSVTVRVDGADALTDFQFSEIAAGVSLPEGEHLIEIIPTGLVDPAITGTVTLEPGMQYTLAAIGGANSWDLELFPMVDDITPDPLNAKVRITHLAPFASALDDTKVDVCTDDGTAVLTNVPYKGFTDPYLSLLAGDYDLLIAVAGTSCGTVALDLPSLRLAAGDIVDVFAIGGANDWDLQVTSITGLTLTPVVNVAHFAPFANTPVGTSVTVRVDGVDALIDFQFSEIAAGIPLPEGEHLIEIIPTGLVDPAITGTVTLEPDMQYTLAAIGGANSWDLELFPLVDDITPDPLNAKVRITHLAPFASDLDDTKVDVCTDDGTAVLTNVPYKGLTVPYLSLPAGDYDLLIAVAGTSCGTVALDLPSLRFAAGDIVDVFAIGGANDWDLQVTSITGFELTPAYVAVGHFAPFAAGLENTSVTVSVDGSDVLTDFVFGELTGYVELTPDVDHLVEVIPTGAVDPAISGTFNLEGGQRYTLSAIGGANSWPLELFPLVDDNTPPMADMAHLRVVHFAPFADTLPATTVDVCTDSGTVVIPGVPYKGYTDPYLELPRGLYNLKVTAAGSNCGTLIFDIPTILLRNGVIASVFAVGGANGFDPTVITTPNLTPIRTFLPYIAR